MDETMPAINDRLNASALSDPASLKRIATMSDPKARAEALAGQLEGVFFSMMVKSMRATVPEGGLLGKGLGGRNYVEMLDQQLSELSGMPRDSRFHEALVRQIMQNPEETSRNLAKMSEK